MFYLINPLADRQAGGHEEVGEEPGTIIESSSKYGSCLLSRIRDRRRVRRTIIITRIRTLSLYQQISIL